MVGHSRSFAPINSSFVFDSIRVFNLTLNSFNFLIQLSLRSPTATGSPFGRWLAPWFGPGFEIFRF